MWPANLYFQLLNLQERCSSDAPSAMNFQQLPLPPPPSTSTVASFDDGHAWRYQRYAALAHIKQEMESTPHDDSGISPGRSGSGSSGGPSPDRLQQTPPPQEVPPPPPPAEPNSCVATDNVISESTPVQHSPPHVQPKTEPPSPSQTQPVADEHSSSSSQSEADGGEDALRRLQVALETSELLRPGTTFQCPLCTFNTRSRELFNSHLGTHYEHKCPTCETVVTSAESLRTHMREAHALSPPQDDPAETKVNSQGRVKTFRCKQCGFLAITKLSFWEHSRCHIRAERLLTCPRCPFVTEYKHHLEYHMRNHTGCKPFRCDKCSYQCVNKSMLNSHLKSHSNIYQYRCADCSYATKYCHSLKLHLRKYSHQPGPVLNSDGSPNPVPIIDVYGTRRGPKQRPKTQQIPTSTPQQTSTSVAETSTSQPHLQSPQALQPHQQFPFGVLTRPGGLPFPFSNLPFPPTTTPMAPAFPYNPVPREGTDAASYDAANAYYTGRAAVHMTPYYVNNNNSNEPASQEEDENGVKDYLSHFLATAQLHIPKVPMPVVSATAPPPVVVSPPATPVEQETSDPLDLSKPDTSAVQNASPAATSAAQYTTSKNRRKGKAYKLERIAMKLQYEADDDEEEDIGVCSGDDGPENKVPRMDHDQQSETGEGFSCIHCGITFRNVVMYSLHKGYHGRQDPFTCNSCGQRTADCVEFFVHLARSAHS